MATNNVWRARESENFDLLRKLLANSGIVGSKDGLVLVELRGGAILDFVDGAAIFMSKNLNLGGQRRRWWKLWWWR